MKTLPRIETGFESLFELLMGPVKMASLLTAIELDLFDLMEGSTPLAEEVAASLNAHETNTGLLLDALTAMGLLDKRNGRYTNSERAATFLVRQKETYLGEMFLALARLQHRDLGNLKGLVQNGPAPLCPEMNLTRKEKWAAATGYLANYQRAGMAQDAVAWISSFSEFAGLSTLLDLSGGPGLVGISLVLAHPTLTGVLFDLPGVTDAAQAAIRAYGVDHRMTAIAGDYNCDDFGSGYDLIWTSMNLYYVKGPLEKFMKRLYNALNPGGILVSFHEGLDRERTHPALPVITRLGVAMSGQDLSFDRGRLAQAMLKAGFSSVHSTQKSSPVGLMDLDIGRKRP